ncbi:apicoplast ribosomal protein S6, putative [Plasmodium berghei]|uniref:Apicoplast ribosomal protein S6, putative n=2 Tax=Plasmodium berghei TaxID=5821 RepID=A0A509AHX5_PLABA|nr:apicoplast ribosomal protein S6, putative [Plasmodium berghei ANKA]CXI36666.1 apicoplast ribosomal protein S6, putative [Plasmodium berghei]SCM21613.1 apicoplast ribosomal protein S6, putative [Plasmodium berghei]SCN24817.1 apicoplast ribosomal protein S6, putative [Plasmodium berghei]SCO59937.1 apicoplast ribosomal protein S6, putative [Plasmodium berghei]SCO61299.1 apicoplast ribosomal protein S6, putative [Plasmodium berghei]|eukprot:XP_034421308.1 apicoplast ribosomal protein S6, putative [Plasmodium berghei ANKA]
MYHIMFLIVIFILTNPCKSFRVNKIERNPFIKNRENEKEKKNTSYFKNVQTKPQKIIKHNKLYGSFNDYIYKLLIKKFKKVKEKKDINIYKSLQSPKNAYNADILFSCEYTISEIKKKLSEYIYELKLVHAQNFKILYMGKRRLIRPIKKQFEAYYILFSFEVYPSIIRDIFNKLRSQNHILRLMITKDEYKTKNIEFKEDDSVINEMNKVEQSFFFKKSA